MNRVFSLFVQSMLMLSLPAVLSLVFAPLTTAAEIDPLWQKAVAIAAANDGLVPGKIIEDARAYRTEDKIDQHTISHLEIYVDKDKKLQARLLSSTRDGKDYTREKQAEMDQRKGDRLAARKGNIFLPENQDTVTAERTNRKKTIEGHACVAFEFTQALPDSTTKGVVWVDEITGVPYRVTATPKNLPDIKKVRIESAQVTFDYSFYEDGKWVLDTLTLNADIEVKIFLFLTYRGHYKVVSSFKDHVRMDARP